MAATAGPQLPPDSTGKTMGAFSFGSGPTIYLPAGVWTDSAGNELASATSAPAGTERGLITRPIGPVSAVGNVASGATDSGAPVKVGGIVDTANPLATIGATGTRQDVKVTGVGSVAATLVGGTGYAVSVGNTVGDANSTSSIVLGVVANALMFNGTSWDRMRGDTTRGLHVDATNRLQSMYFFNTGTTVHVAAASTLMWDFFNASAITLRVLLIQHIVNLETAVTGVGFEWQLLRTTAVGTGGTAQTAWLADTVNDAALDAGVTMRLKPTGGGTAGTSLKWYYNNSEETLAGNQLQAGTNMMENVVPAILAESGKGIVLHQNQGLRLNQETNSAAGNSAFLVGFVIDGV